MSVNEQLKLIEQNHLDHFAFLPKKLGADVYEVNGVTLINCGLQTSMFNIAYGIPKALSCADAIPKIKKAFAGKPFAWWIPPRQHNNEATKSLLASGLIMETIEHAMICDLAAPSSFTPRTELLIKHVTDKRLLEDFISALEPYDPVARRFMRKWAMSCSRLKKS